MADIRFLGRARGGRCVYCHDSLSGDVQTCPECSATWHEDCGRGAPRCPTTGCSGPAPGATTRPGRRRSRPPTPTAAVHEISDADRRRPSPVARGEVDAHLRQSLIANLVTVVVTGSYLIWVATHWHTFWSAIEHLDRGGRRSGGTPVLAGISLAVAALFLLACAHWLRRLPGVYREVTSLLDDTRPTAMRLSVASEREGKSEVWYATLVGGGTSLKLPLRGLLTPEWIKRRMADRPVLVYGLPPPGPYIVEFPDGALALVHPD